MGGKSLSNKPSTPGGVEISGDTSAGFITQSGADGCSPPLIEELRACLPVLPVLASQLGDAARCVEQAVVKVCGNFRDMAQRARQAASHSLLATEGAEDAAVADGAVGGLISHTRVTMAKLLQRAEQTSQHSAATAQHMQEIEGRVSGLQGMLHQIDDIAADARVLALNGRIEAARIGEQGAAFAVVARETARMAHQAVSASKSVEQNIGAISEDIVSASSDLQQRAAADHQEAARSRAEVNQTLDAMAALHEQMQAAVEAARCNSEQLARDVSQAIVAMQFQDTVSQRIEHVVRTLSDIHAALQAHLDERPTDTVHETPDQVPVADWTGRMAEHYTMVAERNILAGGVAEQTDGAHSEPGSVELF